MEETRGEKEITINLGKKRHEWWDCLIEGHAEMPKEDMQPLPITLSDLPPDSRGEVEKMIFDMRAKQTGQPTSEQIQAQDMLKKAMQKNPELSEKFDFSQAKFTSNHFVKEGGDSSKRAN